MTETTKQLPIVGFVPKKHLPKAFRLYDRMRQANSLYANYKFWKFVGKAVPQLNLDVVNYDIVLAWNKMGFVEHQDPKPKDVAAA
ncbi:MAG: hypothetical protein PHN44_03710 [Candidatus Marinimicrobia bacterium]|jgi:hypothetical protein|nr:hypothetical protein [Candidatus Neomarinimicrobiota bacterium]MDD5539323.1 hypothetical protein [Candidatus Neomarinimicrobiota bacterium]